MKIKCAKCGKLLKPHFTFKEFMGWRKCHDCSRKAKKP